MEDGIRDLYQCSFYGGPPCSNSASVKAVHTLQTCILLICEGLECAGARLGTKNELGQQLTVSQFKDRKSLISQVIGSMMVPQLC